ncbi:hypothetical protein QOZ80_1BG0066030 [Eleusine coracana subsp. coracana]|nr:hypothetical protein QOZ80_1BG0066030 [Eleusine coracana subsp. coracana]
MSPVKVFGLAAFSNVARVLVCLEEAGAEYEIVESRAIRKYTATTADGISAVAAMDAWLDVEALEYEPSLHTVFVQHRVVPFLGGTPDEEIIAGSVEKLRKVLEVYRVRGAADRAQAWWEDVLARPAVHKVAAMMGLMADHSGS